MINRNEAGGGLVIKNDVSMESIMEEPGTRPGEDLLRYVEQHEQVLKKQAKSTLESKRELASILLRLSEQIKADNEKKN